MVPTVEPGLVRWARPGAACVATVSMAISAGACEFGKTEVQNLDWATLGEKDVRGLDVAMDDSLSVSGVEGVGELDADVKHAIEG